MAPAMIQMIGLNSFSDKTGSIMLFASASWTFTTFSSCSRTIQQSGIRLVVAKQHDVWPFYCQGYNDLPQSKACFGRARQTLHSCCLGNFPSLISRRSRTLLRSSFPIGEVAKSVVLKASKRKSMYAILD